MGLRGLIYARLDTADAESLLSSFRRVLRGVCDGDVLLDSQMNVAQESQCLRHLILTDVSLKGKSFEHLLVDDEQRTRFREFAYEWPRICTMCLFQAFLAPMTLTILSHSKKIPSPGRNRKLGKMLCHQCFCLL
eukprot:g23497.t1